MKSMRVNMLLCGLLSVVLGFSADALSAPPFGANSQEFWDSSENWTTGYGPAYRDTIEKLENLVPCTGEYALCFHSGPEPLPCELTGDGRSANCKCTVKQGINFVLISAILNYQVYLDTVEACASDPRGCAVADTAPVCQAIKDRKLIPGVALISTYDPDAQSAIRDILLENNPGTACPKGPYAACMTAPCKKTKAGDAECSCPVFWGAFQLTQTGVQCGLGDDQVWSSSFHPSLLNP